FGALTPLEPRLGKKLIEPLTNLIHSTSAMSLLYECINTVIAVLISISSGMPNHSASIQLCVQKLRILIEDSDQNLKYLGLLAMSKILRTHPKSVQAHKDLVLQCLDDKDESIRLRALDLLYGMVSKKNLMEIVKKLMVHMDRAEGSAYRDELLSKVIDICSQNNYQYITNFEWYVSVLVELTRIEGTKHGLTIASQMMDVAVRVQAVRAFSVSQMAVLLENTHLLVGNGQRNSICEVLYAAAWICGEYSDLLEDPRSSLDSLLRPRACVLPPHIQSAYVHNALKLWARMLAQEERANLGDSESSLSEGGQEACTLLCQRLPLFVHSGDLEVQERACCALHLVRQVSKMQARGERVGEELRALFAGDLNPVAPKAQKKVPLPEGGKESVYEKAICDFFNTMWKAWEPRELGPAKARPTREKNCREPLAAPFPLAQMREARKQEQANNPHYLKATPKSRSSNGHIQGVGVEDIPVAEIDLSVPLHIPGLISSDKYLSASRKAREVADGEEGGDRRKKKKKRRRRKGEEEEEEKRPPPEVPSEEELPAEAVNTSLGEMPEGARLTDDEDDDRHKDDPHRALDIDLEHDPVHARCRPLHEERPPRHQDHPSVLPDVTPEVEEPQDGPRLHKRDGDRKHRKKKKEHRHKSKERKHRRREESPPVNAVTETVDREESAGDAPATHAKCVSSPQPASNYKLLADDQNVKLVYEVRPLPGVVNQVVVSIIFTNQSSCQLKEMELGILDTLNTKLVRGVDSHDGVKVPFQLPPCTANEGQFAFTVDSVSMAQRLRGTFTYMLVTDTGSTHEKLDFKLHLPVSSYLIGTMYKRDTFAELLRGGELSAKSGFTLDSVEFEFSHVLSKICFHCHFTVVEQVELSASLYSRSIQDDHICLLVKHMNPNRLHVDGKSTNGQLLSSLMDEVRALLSASAS
ncbi:AP-3 complex subunit delta-1, putative, partial [Ixodes scapularis]